MRTSSSATSPHATRRAFIKLFVRKFREVTVMARNRNPMHQFGTFVRFTGCAVTFRSHDPETLIARRQCLPRNHSIAAKKRRLDMNKKIQMALAMTGITLGLSVAPALAQSDSASNSKMSKMSDKDKMIAMDKMSNEEKAAMFDQMSDANKMMATKMAGHDMSKMSAHDRMMMTDKMSVEDKAMMYEKMAMGNHMDKKDKAAMEKARMEKMKK
jgi:hypothetical protein